MKIIANGTAVVEGVKLTWQEITVEGEYDTIYDISYGKYTVRAVKEEFLRLLKHPEYYYAVPEYPEPMTMKAAIVAMHSIWDSESINVEGTIDEETNLRAGVIY